VINAMLWLLYPWKTAPIAIVQDDWEALWLVCTGVEDLVSSPPPGFKTPTIQPVTSSYDNDTD
jgi:hypothetical protein